MNMPRYSVLAAILWAVAFCPAAFGQTGSIYVSPNEAFFAPPTPWGQELAGGPLRAAFITRPEAARDIAAMADRLEMENSSHLLSGPVEMNSPEVQSLLEFLEGRRGGGLLGNILDASDESRVVVIGGAPIAWLPEKARSALTDFARRGGGLVWIRYEPEPLPEDWSSFIEGTSPVEDPPQWREGLGVDLAVGWRDVLDGVSGWSAADGRLVEMQFGAPRPPRHFLLPPLEAPLLASRQAAESYYALAARAMLWASGRRAANRIVDVQPLRTEAPEEQDIPLFLPEEYVEQLMQSAARPVLQTYRLELNKPAESDYVVVSQLRQPGRNWQARIEYETPLAKGQKTYDFSIMAGPGGYFLDLWLLEPQGEVVWRHTAAIESEGWPSLNRVVLSKRLIHPHDQLTVTARLATAPAAATTAPGMTPQQTEVPPSLYVRAVDAHGRVVSEGISQAPLAGGTAQVELDFADLLTRFLKIEIYAVEAARQEVSPLELNRADYEYWYVPVRQASADEPFSVVVREEATADLNQRDYLRDLAGLGVDLAWTPAAEESGFFLARSPLRPIYEVADWAPEAVLDGVVRVPSLASPNFREEQAARISELGASLWGTESSLFVLGPRNCIALSDANLDQAEPSLAEFRKVMRDEYGSLEALNAAWQSGFESWDAVLPAPAEAAAAFGAYPSWIDFRKYMDQQFLAAHLLGRDAVHAVRPAGRVGFGAAEGFLPWRGYDWRLLGRELDVFALPDDDLVLTQLRSHGRPGRFALIAMKEPEPEQQGAQGDDGFWQFLRQGAGESGMTARESFYAWAPWHAVLQGAQGVMLPDHAEADLLDAQGEPLPHFEAFLAAARELDRGAAEVLRRAQRETSGIVVLDSQTSRYVEWLEEKTFGAHLRASLEMLSELDYGSALAAPGPALRGALEGQKLLLLPGVFALSDADAEAVRSFVRQGGKLLMDGSAAYDERGVRRSVSPLQELIESAPENGVLRMESFSKVSDAALKKVGEFIAEAVGEEARLPDVSIKGGQGFAGEAASYRLGEARLHLAVRAPGEGGEARCTVELDSGGPVYDVLAGERLRGSALREDLPPGGAMLVAELPYEVEALHLAAPESAVLGRRLQFALDVAATAPPGLHVFETSVEFQPVMGMPILRYRKISVGEHGQVRDYVPLALNDPPGRYLVRSRDVLTGATAEALVNVTSSGEQLQEQESAG